MYSGKESRKLQTDSEYEKRAHFLHSKTINTQEIETFHICIYRWAHYFGASHSQPHLIVFRYPPEKRSLVKWHSQFAQQRGFMNGDGCVNYSFPFLSQVTGSSLTELKAFQCYLLHLL